LRLKTHTFRTASTRATAVWSVNPGRTPSQPSLFND
jgi:hypothetical protein